MNTPVCGINESPTQSLNILYIMWIFVYSCSVASSYLTFNKIFVFNITRSGLFIFERLSSMDYNVPRVCFNGRTCLINFYQNYILKLFYFSKGIITCIYHYIHLYLYMYYSSKVTLHNIW